MILHFLTFTVSLFAWLSFVFSAVAHELFAITLTVFVSQLTSRISMWRCLVMSLRSQWSLTAVWSWFLDSGELRYLHQSKYSSKCPFKKKKKLIASQPNKSMFCYLLLPASLEKVHFSIQIFCIWLALKFWLNWYVISSGSCFQLA